MTILLSDRTREHVAALFAAGDRERAQQLLEPECADDLPLWLDKTPEGLERIRFAVLKLCRGELDQLGVWLEEAALDWRAVLRRWENGSRVPG